MNVRKITVCALLGQLKQMAVSDLTLPILRSLKSPSQLGFTLGLFFKLANLMVTEKRAWAHAHVQILLIQFLELKIFLPLSTMIYLEETV